MRAGAESGGSFKKKTAELLKDEASASSALSFVIMTRYQHKKTIEEFAAMQVHGNNQTQELFSAEGVKTAAGQDVAGLSRVKITKYSF